MDRKTIITESLNYIENNIKNKITSDEIFDQAEKKEVLEETGVEYEIDRLAFIEEKISMVGRAVIFCCVKKIL